MRKIKKVGALLKEKCIEIIFQKSPNIPIIDTLSVDLKRISLEDLSFVDQLGEGQFGVVVAATAINIGAVAVKMARPGAAVSDLADLVTEYNLLRDLDHPNVIRLVGACTDSRWVRDTNS